VRATDVHGNTSNPTVRSVGAFIDGMFVMPTDKYLVTTEDTPLSIDARSWVEYHEPWIVIGGPEFPPNPFLEGPSNGTLTGWTYVPDPGFTGTDTFQWAIVGESGDVSWSEPPARVFITVEPAAVAPGDVSVSAATQAPTELSLTFSVTAGTAPTGGTITDSSIDFGILEPNTPKTGSHRLEVLTNASNGYQVTASEDTSLTTGTYSIPDVVGDDEDITEVVAGAWDSATTLGFGYTMADVLGTPAAFTTGYKQFADESGGETAQSIMSATGPTTGESADVSYKLNVGPAQEEGTYTNTVAYVATGNL
jgi:hypothetical protein